MDRRRANLRVALAFLRLPPTEPELQLLHRWLDTWTGVGLITVGVERHGNGCRSATSRTASGGPRSMENDNWAPRGFGVAPTPWGAVQQAAWAAVNKYDGRVAAARVSSW